MHSVSFPTCIPMFSDFSVCIISSKYIVKSNGDSVQPCLSPLSVYTQSVSMLFSVYIDFVFWYRCFIVSIRFLCMPSFSIIFHSLSLSTKSYAFSRSKKAQNVSVLFSFEFSIIWFIMYRLSVPLLSFLKPFCS